ncbi:MAG: hypothetical protein EAZ07_00805 [Cytophagales bacterium]|nr:MAG: hypothetical protein EAZ07_00805 [Cytophagales bacterium]
MTDRIQKTIISKFLSFINREFITENEILELLSTVDEFYKNQLLSKNNFYRQKIELIVRNLTSAAKTVKKNRINKFVKLKLNDDLLRIFIKDLENFNLDIVKFTEIKKLDNETIISISKQNVQKTLENLIIPKRRLKTEIDFEKFVSEQLAQIFGKESVHRQYNIGGFLALKTDIDIGNGQVGIELKIADNLTASDMQRLIGQVIYYKSRFYKNNLLLFIASKSTINPTTNELINFVEELGIKVIFSTAINI